MLGANNKVKLIHNGIKTPEFKTREEARAFIKEAVKTTGVSINDNDFVIGAIGELHKNKGYQYLIDAFDQVNRDKSANFKLVIISDGEERKKLEDKIKELGLESVISLVGFIKDAPIYLRAFDAFALTSIKEGLPYVVIEAGFAGLPTIATNVGGVREIIDDMKSGILVQTRKPDEIAQGLLHISREKEKAELYGQNLKQKVCQEFSMEKMITKTLEVYSGRI
jgi:glycosyltransferase involved in cell wall biosynthesis